MEVQIMGIMSIWGLLHDIGDPHIKMSKTRPPPWSIGCISIFAPSLWIAYSWHPVLTLHPTWINTNFMFADWGGRSKVWAERLPACCLEGCPAAPCGFELGLWPYCCYGIPSLTIPYHPSNLRHPTHPPCPPHPSPQNHPPPHPILTLLTVY